MNYLDNLFEKILNEKQLVSLFQPIVNIKQNSIYAYEGLIRGPKDTKLHTPIALFDYARENNKTAELEFACREQSIKQFSDLNRPIRLFLNVSPSVLTQPGFKKGKTIESLEKYGLSPSYITIEITENQQTKDYELLKDATLHYRNMGFKIAMDDLGAGYSGLRLWSELLPDYVKIDRYFIENIHKDKMKYNFVQALQSIAQDSSCQIIAEGVETLEEFLVVKSLGITFAQGYYFERPSLIPSKKLNIEKQDSLTSVSKKTRVGDTSINAILKEVSSILPYTTNKNVLRIFQTQSKVTVLPVVDLDGIIGLVYKDQFLAKLFASPYGLDLHGEKKIAEFIDCSALIFDQHYSIQNVSNELTNSCKNHQAFIISDKGKYKGIATVMELLEVITKKQIQSAKHANPLTLLPGIIPMHHLINTIIDEGNPFSVAYIDLDNFKPYNDIYGYEKGDQVIKLLSTILTETIHSNMGCVGHIGGDDFIAVMDQAKGVQQCEDVLEKFKVVVKDLYSKQDLENESVFSKSRQGKACFFPLMTLSIGVVDYSSIENLDSHLQVSVLLAEAKSQAKMIIGNSCFVNRRLMKQTTNKFIQRNSFNHHN